MTHIPPHATSKLHDTWTPLSYLCLFSSTLRSRHRSILSRHRCSGLSHTECECGQRYYTLSPKSFPTYLRRLTLSLKPIPHLSMPHMSLSLQSIGLIVYVNYPLSNRSHVATLLSIPPSKGLFRPTPSVFSLSLAYIYIYILTRALRSFSPTLSLFVRDRTLSTSLFFSLVSSSSTRSYAAK